MLRTGCLLCVLVAVAGCGGGGGSSGSRQPPDGDNDGFADAQDCAASDATRWQLLAFQSVDLDADGRRVNSSGQICSGSALPSTHFAAAVAAGDVDCDDTNASISQLRPYASRDVDADGFSIASSGEVCSGAALPAGYGTTAPTIAAADCDDTIAAIWRLRMTFRDADADGVGAGAGEISCMGSGAPTGRSLRGYDPIDDPGDPNAGTVSNLELASWQLTTP
jgi:hypothetical protein